jgi:hypothetical protein
VGGLWVQTRKVDYLRVSYIYLEYRAVYQIHRDNVSKTRNKNRISPELIELEYEMERLFQHLAAAILAAVAAAAAVTFTVAGVAFPAAVIAGGGGGVILVLALAGAIPIVIFCIGEFGDVRLAAMAGGG